MCVGIPIVVGLVRRLRIEPFPGSRFGGKGDRILLSSGQPFVATLRGRGELLLVGLGAEAEAIPLSPVGVLVLCCFARLV